MSQGYYLSLDVIFALIALFYFPYHFRNNSPTTSPSPRHTPSHLSLSPYGSDVDSPLPSASSGLPMITVSQAESPLSVMGMGMGMAGGYERGRTEDRGEMFPRDVTPESDRDFASNTNSKEVNSRPSLDRKGTSQISFNPKEIIIEQATEIDPQNNRQGMMKVRVIPAGEERDEAAAERTRMRPGTPFAKAGEMPSPYLPSEGEDDVWGCEGDDEAEDGEDDGFGGGEQGEEGKKVVEMLRGERLSGGEVRDGRAMMKGEGKLTVA